MASNHLIKSQYLKYFLVALAMGLLLRFIETAQVYFKFNPKYLLASEGFGVLRDIFITGLILIFTYPLYHSLHRKWPVHGKLLTWFFIGTFVFLHIAISEYFFYQLRPLDIFLFKHRPEEMAFSIQTAGFNVYLPFFLKSIFVLLSYYLLVLYVERKTLPVQWAKPIAVGYAMASIVFLPIYFFVKLPVSSNLSVNKSTFLYSNIVLDWYHSVFGPDRAKLANHYQEHFPDRKYLSGQYPFLHQFEPDDRLGSHLDSLASAPNLVVIIVEGLSDDFIHPIQGIPFMPYLDSLSTKSLYWKHFFATSERSFGATPSINGSLPYANDGFALLHQYPYHFSLANIFKENQFLTSFYYGQGAWFHGKEAFYRFNNIDRIIDKTVFNKQLEKVYVGPDNHFWGYNDMDLFQQYFLSTDSIRDRKRYDVFFTGTSHAPFALKHPDRYHKKLDAAIAGLSGLEAQEHFEKYRTYYTSLYNVDEAIRYFMESYSNRPDYEQTLFVITGDHPMTEIPVENELKKYQVPLIVYSPLIREPQTFQEFASHLDLYETLLSYYHNQFQLNVPAVSTAIGHGLKFSSVSDTKTSIPFMNDNRQIFDFFCDGYYISNDHTLYKVGEGLELKEIYDIKTWDRLHKKLECLRAASQQACVADRLMPEKYYFDFFNYQLLQEFRSMENLATGNQEVCLVDATLVPDRPVFVDFNFKRMEHLEFTPQCIIRIYDPEGQLKRLITRELNSHLSECQFHIPIPAEWLSDPDGPCSVSVGFNTKEGHRSSIFDISVKLYAKGLKTDKGLSLQE